MAGNYFILAFTAICFVLCSGTVVAQNIEEAQHDEANKIAQNAVKELGRGHHQTADSLIQESIDLYPNNTVIEYAEALAKTSDVTGCNIILFKLLARLDHMPRSIIYFSIPTAVGYKNGMVVSKNFRVTKNSVIDIKHVVAMNGFRINRNFGDKADLDRILKYTLEIENYGNATKGVAPWHDYAQTTYYVLQGDFDAAMEAQKKIDKEHPTWIEFLVDKGEYQQAIALVEAKDDPINGVILTMAYAYLGEKEKAEAEYKKLDARLKNNPDIFYAFAVGDIRTGRFNEAIKRLNEIQRNQRTTGINNVYKWKLYSAFGDAFLGLKDWKKAKDNYELALLYHNSYANALRGKATLDRIFAQNLQHDKTLPNIELTEPACSPAYKLETAAASVMLKGIIRDDSGVKDVLVNEKPVYTQANGNFWGEVPLRPGLNKLTLTAVDLAGNRSQMVIEATRTSSSEVITLTGKEGKNYCLLLAAEKYADPSVATLSRPIADATKLKVILKTKYDFDEENIVTVWNPTNSDLKRTLISLANQLQPNDNLIVFYAGHGSWNDKEKKGYWLLTDARKNVLSTWMPNKTVLDLIASIPSRHTLLITDACFSGSVFKTRSIDAGQQPDAVKVMADRVSRVAITSGNNTEVPDESVFMKYLLKALGDNQERYLAAQKMFINQILEAVITESKTEPRYGTLELAGHIGGDFIFKTRSK